MCYTFVCRCEVVAIRGGIAWLATGDIRKGTLTSEYLFLFVLRTCVYAPCICLIYRFSELKHPRQRKELRVLKRLYEERIISSGIISSGA